MGMATSARNSRICPSASFSLLAALVVSRLELLREDNKNIIPAIEALTEKLGSDGIPAKVKVAAEEALFDLHQGAAQEPVAGKQLSDIFAFRIVVANPHDCHHALGIVHTTWSMVPAVQGLRLDAEAERPSLDPHHGGRSWAPAWSCRSAPRRCIASPNTRRPCPLQGRRSHLRRPQHRRPPGAAHT